MLFSIVVLHPQSQAASVSPNLESGTFSVTLPFLAGPGPVPLSASHPQTKGTFFCFLAPATGSLHMYPMGDSFGCFSPSCSMLLPLKEKSSSPGFMPSLKQCLLFFLRQHHQGGFPQPQFFVCFFSPPNPARSREKSLQVAVNFPSISGHQGSVISHWLTLDLQKFTNSLAESFLPACKATLSFSGPQLQVRQCWAHLS